MCLLDADDGALYSGDTLFAGGWGRVDLPGGSADEIAASLGRLADLEDRVRVLPGHGSSTTIGRERAWLDLVRRDGPPADLRSARIAAAAGSAAAAVGRLERRPCRGRSRASSAVRTAPPSGWPGRPSGSASAYSVNA